MHLSVGPTFGPGEAARAPARSRSTTPATRPIGESAPPHGPGPGRLREVGAADLAPGVETSILTLGLNPRVPADVHATSSDRGRGFPLAVFAAYPDVACPGPTGG